MSEQLSLEKKRTLQQNKAIHVLFKMISDALNDAGLDLHAVLKSGIDIPWTPIMVKEVMWKSVLLIMKNKKSTTEMTTKEIDEVFDVVNRQLSLMGLTVEFPSVEVLMLMNPSKI